MVAHYRSHPIKATCVYCECEYDILLDLDDLEDWLHGKGRAVDIFHYLTKDEIELIVTAVCKTCWDDLEERVF